MEPWKQRVIDEKEQLDERMTKLDAYMETDAFRDLYEDERGLLLQQIDAMDDYARILRYRIDKF